jgi:hypothetical protein
MAQSVRRRSADAPPVRETIDTSRLVAAALCAGWMVDALHRQIAELIKRGLVYPPERGMLAFTVPGMHEFVLRQDGHSGE